ncbi:MAG: fasciclin domain-containing protein [Bdellovibrionales bacterium]
MNKTRTFAFLSSLLLGFSLSFSALAATPPAKPENVMKILKENKDLSKFADLVEKAGLESELTSKDARLTIFAPNNAAMDKLSSDVLDRAKETKDGLKNLVHYHMINGSVVFATNIKGRRASPSSASGEMIGFDGMGKTLKVGEATITTEDLGSNNGVVQVISAVLVPDSLKDPKIKEAQKEKEEAAMKKEMEEREKETAKKMESSAPAAVAPVKGETPATAPSVAGSAPVAAPAPKEEKKSFLKGLFGR